MICFRTLLPGVLLLLVSAVLATGCGKKDNKTTTPSATTTTTAAAADPRIKEGWLYHTEDETHHIRLKIDKSAKEIRAVLLDRKAAKIEPIKAKSLTLFVGKSKPQVEIVLEAKPHKDDGADHCSVFIGKTDKLPEKIDKKTLEITTEIAGTSYSFLFDDEHK